MPLVRAVKMRVIATLTFANRKSSNYLHVTNRMKDAPHNCARVSRQRLGDGYDHFAGQPGV